MIAIEDLVKNYEKNRVLKGVTLHVPPAALFGFVGVNGAGKSTLIKCLLRFVTPQSGRIAIHGKSIFKFLAYKKILGYLPEVFQPPLDLRCGEFLNYCGELLRGKPCSDQEIQTFLQRVGLSEHKHSLIRVLSKGMRQRLGIAQTLVNAPKLLILDEPFSGLDPIGRHELKNLLRSLHGEGITIFFSSHNLTEIQDLCTHAAILHGGILQACALVADLLVQHRETNLENVFLKVVGYGASPA
jgi:ABC-2 type transport system ATP-binding protein